MFFIDESSRNSSENRDYIALEGHVSMIWGANVKVWVAAAVRRWVLKTKAISENHDLRSLGRGAGGILREREQEGAQFGLRPSRV
jgi:hypothetical protein